MICEFKQVPKRTLGSLFLRTGGWMFIIVILVATAFAGFSVYSRGRAQGLARDGRDSMAMIVNKSHHVNGVGAGRSHNTTYRVSYRFATADGKQLIGIQDVSAGFFELVHEGDHIKVRYLPVHPATSEIEQGRNGNSSTTFLGASLLIFAGGLGGLIVWWRKARSMIMLRDRGVPRAAKVTQLELIKSGKSAKSPARHGRALWRDDTGETGRSLVRAKNDLPSLQQVITIFADPAGKLPSVWEGDVGSR